MEAFGLLLHGFAVLLTWKTLALMMVGLVLGVFVGVLPGLGGPNGVAILLLFFAGYAFGRHAGRRPWLTGFAVVALGGSLVGIAIALGG